MPPAGFESTISAGERPHNYALDRLPLGPARDICLKIINAEDWERDFDCLL